MNRRDLKILYAIYLLDCLSKKVEKPSRRFIEHFLNETKTDTGKNQPDDQKSKKVSSNTIEGLFKSYREKSDGLLKTKEETLENIAALLNCEYKNADAIRIAVGRGRETKHLKAMKSYLKVFENSPSNNSEINNRLNSFCGTWEGISYEHKGNFPIKININRIGSSTKVSGEIVIHYHIEPESYNQVHELFVEGEILDKKDYVRLDYTNKNRDTLHFGTIYFKLSSDGHVLDGVFAGHGITTQNGVKGSVVVKK